MSTAPTPATPEPAPDLPADVPISATPLPPKSDAEQLGRWYLLYRHGPPTLLLFMLFPLALECFRSIVHHPTPMPYFWLGVIAVFYFAFAATNYAAHGLWRALGRTVVGFGFLVAAVITVELAYKALLDERYGSTVSFLFYGLLIVGLLLATHRLAMLDLRLATAQSAAEGPAGVPDELSDFEVQKWDQAP